MQPWTAIAIAFALGCLGGLTNWIGSSATGARRLAFHTLAGGGFGAGIAMSLWWKFGGDLDHVLLLLGISFLVILSGVKALDLGPGVKIWLKGGGPKSLVKRWLDVDTSTTADGDERDGQRPRHYARPDSDPDPSRS